MDHEEVEVFNLHWQVILTEGRRVTIKARSTREDMRHLNPTILVTDVTEPLNWEKTMEMVRYNDCVVDASDNPRTRYLINDAFILAGTELKTVAMTNGVSGRGSGTFPLVSGRSMGTKGQLMVCNHPGGWVLRIPISQAQPFLCL